MEDVDQGGRPKGAARRMRYQPGLDGIRAIAALSVVFFHLRVPGFAGGALGVDVFFTLSGFLITGIILSELLQTGTLSFREFYARRALRLLPAYLVVVLVAVLGDRLIVDAGGTLKGAILSFFYVSNWAAGIWHIGQGTLTHMWSLSVEEQFYLLWPVRLPYLQRVRSTRSLLIIVVPLAAFAWILTGALALSGIASIELMSNATPFRASELLAGCTLAVAISSGHLRPLLDHPDCVRRSECLSIVGLITLVILGSFSTGLGCY